MPKHLGGAVDYERYFAARPARVLGALLQHLGSSGQVLDIREFGTAVTFIPSRAVLGQGRPLVARAQGWHDGTLVQVTEAERSGTEADDEGEFMDLITLLGEVATTLGPDDSEPSAATSPEARGTPRPPRVVDRDGGGRCTHADHDDGYQEPLRHRRTTPARASTTGVDDEADPADGGGRLRAGEVRRRGPAGVAAADG